MKLYLAYGANTNLNNMFNRCPAAKYVCNLTLHHHRLAFRGVADVVPQRGAKVVCALWLITPECEAALDRFEGFPHMYVKRYVTIHLHGKRHRVMFYVMTRPGARGEAEPSAAYEACLREGYAECGMPIGQIDRAIGRAKAWQVAHPKTVSTAHHGSWKAKLQSEGLVTAAPDDERDSDAADEFMMSVYESQMRMED